MGRSHTLTVLGTSDLHGHLLDWDYHRDEPYRDAWGNAVGLARVATVVRRVRAVRHAPLLIDAGDFLQGTPLASYAAPGLRTDQRHPIAGAMDALGFDAAVVGNHEFDFGLEALRAFERQVAFPLLAGNVVDTATGADAFTPYVVREVDVPIGRPVRVAIVGLTHPASGVWNRAQLGGSLRFDGMVGAARQWVSHARESGADVVLVAAHSGWSTGAASVAEDAYDGVERIAEQVPGIDAILAGHEHREVECQTIAHASTGEPTVVTMPMCWGMRVSAIEITIESCGDGYEVVDRSACLIDTSDADEDPEIVRLVEPDHRAVVDSGRVAVGTSAQAMDGVAAAWGPTPLVSLVQHVQAASVVEKIGDLPVLSVASVPHHAAEIPCGAVDRRSVESIAAFDNPVVAVLLTGAGVREHLETAARYFARPAAQGTVLARNVINAPTALHPAGTPDFAYDTVMGFSAPLNYEIDLARPPGDRIRSLTYADAPIADEAEFAVAMSTFRRTGAHGYTAAAAAPMLCESGVGIRALLTDWITANGPLTPGKFHRDNWWLTYEGAALEIVEDEVAP